MFGITENGDASHKLAECRANIGNVDGAILITKKLTRAFKDFVLEERDRYKFIVHVSCTGYGKTKLEPNIDTYDETISGIRELIDKGFPAERIVLRVDPIIPTAKGIRRFETVVRHAREVIPDVTRIRVSVLDMYEHVKRRFAANGLPSPYGDRFQATDAMFKALNNKIEELKHEFPELSFESCAETKIPAAAPLGCVSAKDYQILGLKELSSSRKGQRKNCLCLGAKKDLLKFKYGETGYNHCYGCLYCYWQTEADQKICKNCKHGYNHCDDTGLCTYCYLHAGGYPVRKEQNDTCKGWEPDENDN